MRFRWRTWKSSMEILLQWFLSSSPNGTLRHVCRNSSSWFCKSHTKMLRKFPVSFFSCEDSWTWCCVMNDVWIYVDEAVHLNYTLREKSFFFFFVVYAFDFVIFCFFSLSIAKLKWNENHLKEKSNSMKVTRRERGKKRIISKVLIGFYICSTLSN